MPTFENVSCSQCGQDFGPGDHGYSHCFNHQPPEVWIPELIRNEYDRAPDLGRGSYPAAESEWDDGAEEIARKIVSRLAEREREALTTLKATHELLRGNEPKAIKLASALAGCAIAKLEPTA